MGGNHDTARFIHFADEEFAELAFAGDVQSVGRFVHDEPRGTGGQGKADECLFLLSHRKFAEFDVLRQFEHFQITEQVVMVEMRIERSVEADVLFQVVVRKVEFFGDEEEVAQCVRTAQTHIRAVQAGMSFCWCEEAGHQVEQGGLSDSVFP